MRQTSVTPEEFEFANPASDRPQTHALDCGATGNGSKTNGTWIKPAFISKDNYQMSLPEPSSISEQKVK